MRAADVESLIAQEELYVLLVSETLQRLWKSGIVSPFRFQGSIISMHAHKKHKLERPSMGITFLTKQTEMMERESAQKGGTWKMLEMRYRNLQLLGLYASPSATAQDWRDVTTALNQLRAKRGAIIVCGTSTPDTRH